MNIQSLATNRKYLQLSETTYDEVSIINDKPTIIHDEKGPIDVSLHS